MQRLEVSEAVRPIYGSLGVKRLIACTDCYTVLWPELCVQNRGCIVTVDTSFIFSNKSRLLDGVTHFDAIPNSQF